MTLFLFSEGAFFAVASHNHDLGELGGECLICSMLHSSGNLHQLDAAPFAWFLQILSLFALWLFLQFSVPRRDLFTLTALKIRLND
ncbi:MAG: hypothetical protein FWG82_02705 [Oscillospiraceae bacterium]|nr:hypothetical protein [Oscillospiraceae bacterium]